ncbi:MAG: PQQ-binding-like beta-propeller repeat protein [Sphingomonadaceae bacterium]
MRKAALRAPFIVALSAAGTWGVTYSPSWGAAGSDTPQTNVAAYEGHCAGCHGATLGGSSGPGYGPPLRGEAFLAKWRGVPAASLLKYIRTTMPLNRPASLDDATYLAITNHIRSKNGLELLVADLAALPKRQEADAVAAVAVKSGFDDATSRATHERRSHLAAQLTPVTDAMLDHPAQGDWLAWRRTGDAQGFSPLGQINRKNVASLTIVWDLTLAPGTNGIAPLVHDGVMYLDNSGIVMAVDATSGDMIWQYSRPASTSRAPITQPRGIALYGDAVYVPTIDNHLLALDAKTGQLR